MNPGGTGKPSLPISPRLAPFPPKIFFLFFNFFDNVVVNDENQDIKNNRLELLKMFCNTFDNFIDFSKLEGL